MVLAAADAEAAIADKSTSNVEVENIVGKRIDDEFYDFFCSEKIGTHYMCETGA